MNCECDWTSVSYISDMICITIYVKKVRVFPIFAYFCISCFELTLVGYFFCFSSFLSWVHDGSMEMVREVFHVMFEVNKIRFCWFIHIYNEVHCEILKIISSFDSDVHEPTNPVIYYYAMWFSICFNSFPMRGVAMKSLFSKDVSTVNGDCWNFTSYLFFPQYSWRIFFMIWSVW